jgi:hypothetical protein
MNKYFLCDPDWGCYDVYISDLDDNLKKTLNEILSEFEETLNQDTSDEEYKYTCTAPCCYECYCYSRIYDLLVSSGYKRIKE